MLVREVREGLVDAPDDAECVVWRDGMRIKTERSYGYERRPSPRLTQPPVEPPVTPVEPRWHVVRATPTRISGVNYLTSYAAVGGLSTVAHIANTEKFQMAWRVDRETGKCDETYIHTVSLCGIGWTCDLVPTDFYSAANMIHESLPEGFRLCKSCAKRAEVKICQWCAVPLTGTQKKWCSAHSSAHMRRDSDGLR
jgi:hypothetical protein